MPQKPEKTNKKVLKIQIINSQGVFTNPGQSNTPEDEKTEQRLIRRLK